MSKANNRNKESELEGMHYEILLDWVQKGRSEIIPEEMERYLHQLSTVNNLWNGGNSVNMIKEKLIASYPELNTLTAKKRFEDAVNWFYLDDSIKKDAWRNILFEKQLKLADATILSATEPKHYVMASQIITRAYLIKKLDEDEIDKIPEEAFKRPNKIYSLDTTDFKDLPEKTDRKLLANYIDQMNLTEDQRVRIKQDAGLEPRELFPGHVQEKDTE